ncbi:MAG: branched-chain amino acid ABC transporter substrate-binding protein [Candidatus Rokubacteria bacterium]|nr:branched-chain amino acid ABC transporter substrate-binding protein [Candidatus Rokubacteria bacterium]
MRPLLLILTVLALALPANSPVESQQKRIVKIATQSPLSGGQAAVGEGLRLGAQLAIEQFKGPVEKLDFYVELVSFDDEARSDVAVANARNIIADKEILLVIGHLQGTAISASEVYREAQLAMISPAIHPTLTDRNYSNVSRVSGRDDVQGVAGAEFATSLGGKTAYVIHDRTTYGQRVAESFRDRAKKLGIAVVGFEGTEERSNFDPIITPIKAKNPDLIYFGGIHDQAAPFFKQTREKGVKSKFLGPEGMDSSALAKIAGKAVVGMYYTSVVGPVTVYPKAKEFAKAFKEKFKKDPESFSAQAYDATAIGLKGLEAAIKAAGGKLPSREAVMVAVRKVKHSGITGTIEFDEKGDPKKALYFVFRVVSDDPAKWDESKEVRRLEITAPALKR